MSIYDNIAFHSSLSLHPNMLPPCICAAQWHKSTLSRWSRQTFIKTLYLLFYRIVCCTFRGKLQSPGVWGVPAVNFDTVGYTNVARSELHSWHNHWSVNTCLYIICHQFWYLFYNWHYLLNLYFNCSKHKNKYV